MQILGEAKYNNKRGRALLACYGLYDERNAITVARIGIVSVVGQAHDKHTFKTLHVHWHSVPVHRDI